VTVALRTRGRRREGRSRGAAAELFGEALRQRRTQVGLAIVGLVVAVAIFGPLVAPYGPTDIVGETFAHPSAAHWLGTDVLGRDVLSRFLSGGRTLILLAVLATLFGVGLGTMVGTFAGYSGGRTDEILMRVMDVILAFPPIVLALMFVATAGSAEWLIVVVVGVSHIPQTARVIRAATVGVRDLDFVRYAEAVGVPRRRVVRDEILPNVIAPLTVEVGLRLTFSIGLIASLDYLGLGIQPPTADWGVMIQENQQGLNLSPWPVIVAVLAIAVLTIGTNLATDGIGQSVAGANRSVES
jgi:peptide/nickel transport system permease protein